MSHLLRTINSWEITKLLPRRGAPGGGSNPGPGPDFAQGGAEELLGGGGGGGGPPPGKGTGVLIRGLGPGATQGGGADDGSLSWFVL